MRDVCVCVSGGVTQCESVCLRSLIWWSRKEPASLRPELSFLYFFLSLHFFFFGVKKLHGDAAGRLNAVRVHVSAWREQMPVRLDCKQALPAASPPGKRCN